MNTIRVRRSDGSERRQQRVCREDNRFAANLLASSPHPQKQMNFGDVE